MIDRTLQVYETMLHWCYVIYSELLRINKKHVITLFLHFVLWQSLCDLKHTWTCNVYCMWSPKYVYVYGQTPPMVHSDTPSILRSYTAQSPLTPRLYSAHNPQNHRLHPANLPLMLCSQSANIPLIACPYSAHNPPILRSSSAHLPLTIRPFTAHTLQIFR